MGWWSAGALGFRFVEEYDPSLPPVLANRDQLVQVFLNLVKNAAEAIQNNGEAGEILLTSMDRDGTKGGYNLPLTRAIVDAVGVPVIASGGVGTLDHLVEGVLQGGASAVLAASIFHFGHASVADAKAAMAAAGIVVRR